MLKKFFLSKPVKMIFNFIHFQALFKDLWAILMGILVGKPKIPKWLQGSIIRSGVLVGSTLFLLIARIKVMGAQLPVFTK